MTQIEQIKAEIERQKMCSVSAKKEWIDDGYNQNAFAEDCRIASFDKLLAFIDSLPEEKPSEDLEKAAMANAHPDYYNEKVIAYNPERKEAFILGANWHKEQMLNEAVEGSCFVSPFTASSLFVQTEIFENNKGFRHGETCKVIIVKED